MSDSRVASQSTDRGPSDASEITSIDGTVSVFIPSLAVGGAERVSINLAEGLANSGFDVDLLVQTASGEFEIDHDGIDVVELGASVPPFGIVSAVPGLVNYVRRTEPTAVISSLTRANVTVALAGLVSPTSFAHVAVEHLNQTDKAKPPKERVLFSLAERLYPRIDEIVAVSAGVRDSIAGTFGVDANAITVLPNIVLTEAFRASLDEPVDHPWIEDQDLDVVTTLGRLTEQKDHRTLLRAFAELENEDARLLVLGDGDLRLELERLADDLDVGDDVELMGYVDNPFKYVQRSELFVLSSKREGLPTVLIEALGCGCPIVSTDSPSGPVEVLDDGRYGRLVPVGDAGRLAGAIDSELTKTHDESVLLSRAEEYSESSVVASYARLLERTVED